MSPALLEIENSPLQTGTSIPLWFSRELSGQPTGKSAPSRVIYCNIQSVPQEYSRIAEFFHPQIWEFTVTDPGAAQRAREVGVANWSRSLAQLTAVAKAVIPGLRDPSKAERDNLRQYYRKLFRKV